jgi:hypothetical protein
MIDDLTMFIRLRISGGDSSESISPIINLGMEKIFHLLYFITFVLLYFYLLNSFSLAQVLYENVRLLVNRKSM